MREGRVEIPTGIVILEEKNGLFKSSLKPLSLEVIPDEEAETIEHAINLVKELQEGGNNDACFSAGYGEGKKHVKYRVAQVGSFAAKHI
jgi:hypothetical protein